MDTIIKRMYVYNAPLDKFLPNDLLTSIITVNTPRGINYNKIDDKEVMSDLETRVIIFDGIISGNDTMNCEYYLIHCLLLYLANYPDVKKKMLNEIDRIFKLTKYVQLPKMICLKKHDEIGGYQWSAETIIRINIDAINNNEEYWEEPNKFYPDK
ncbi:hypothetical protein RhiirA4_477240 [Rhizophagus irregularis]|uniref:Cytochrome P450 n=1 Tax=Rhizophagus irregularis TaxID=588596 RepID=A0A2I1HCY3_9GLOM|nr:hypothetical protein RhiirA4_477240 [Rhizophagus irregularis]